MAKAKAKGTGKRKKAVPARFGELDQYLFGQATHYDIYKKLGAHLTTRNRKKGVYFAVWAPNAQAVSVVGDFNKWEDSADLMEKVGPIGVWEVFVPGAKLGDLYKFCIRNMDGREIYKADPYANWSEMRPGTASSRRWPSMRCIPAPGESIRLRRRIPTDFTDTGSLPMPWRSM